MSRWLLLQSNFFLRLVSELLAAAMNDKVDKLERESRQRVANAGAGGDKNVS
jgi:hypothetical protein